MSPTRSRWLRRVSLALVLGLITTVGVSWVAGAVTPTGTAFSRTRSRGLSPREWWLLALDELPARKRVVSTVMIRATQYEESNGLGELPSWAAGLPQPATLNAWPNAHYEIVEGCGWPWVALTYRFSGTGTGAATTGKVIGGIELTPRATGAWYDPRALPIKPHVPGLLGDTAVWSGAWVVLMGVGGKVREARRRRRGLCVSCAYELKGESLCPECGAAAQ